jgi:hypothetical protein
MQNTNLNTNLNLKISDQELKSKQLDAVIYPTHPKFKSLQVTSSSKATFSSKGILHFNAFTDLADVHAMRKFLNELLSPKVNKDGGSDDNYESVEIPAEHEVAQFLTNQLRHQIGDTTQQYKFKISASRIHKHNNKGIKFSEHIAEAVITLEPIIPSTLMLLGSKLDGDLFNAVSIIADNAQFKQAMEDETRDNNCVDKNNKVIPQVVCSDSLAIYAQNADNINAEEARQNIIAELQKDSVDNYGTNYTIGNIYAAYENNKKYILLALQYYTKDMGCSIDIDVNKDYSAQEFSDLIKAIIYNMQNARFDPSVLCDYLNYINSICGNRISLLDSILGDNEENSPTLDDKTIQNNIKVKLKILRILHPNLIIQKKDENNPCTIVKAMQMYEDSDIDYTLKTIEDFETILNNKADAIKILKLYYPDIIISENSSDNDFIALINDNGYKSQRMVNEIRDLKNLSELYTEDKVQTVEFLSFFYPQAGFSGVDNLDIFKQKVIKLISDDVDNSDDSDNESIQDSESTYSSESSMDSSSKLSFNSLGNKLSDIMEYKQYFEEMQNNNNDDVYFSRVKNLISTLYPDAIPSDNITFVEMLNIIKANNGKINDVEIMLNRFGNIIECPIPIQAAILKYIYPSIDIEQNATIEQFIHAVHEVVKLDPTKDFNKVAEGISDTAESFGWVFAAPSFVKLAIESLHPEINLTNNVSVIELIDNIVKICKKINIMSAASRLYKGQSLDHRGEPRKKIPNELFEAICAIINNPLTSDKQKNIAIQQLYPTASIRQETKVTDILSNMLDKRAENSIEGAIDEAIIAMNACLNFNCSKQDVIYLKEMIRNTIKNEKISDSDSTDADKKAKYEGIISEIKRYYPVYFSNSQKYLSDNINYMIEESKKSITDYYPVHYGFIKEVAQGIQILSSSKKLDIARALAHIYPKYNPAASNIDFSVNSVDNTIADIDIIKMCNDIAAQYKQPYTEVLNAIYKDVSIANDIKDMVESNLIEAANFIKNIETVYIKYNKMSATDIDFDNLDINDCDTITNTIYKICAKLNNNEALYGAKDLNLYDVYYFIINFARDPKEFLFKNMSKYHFATNGMLYVGLNKAKANTALYGLQQALVAPPLVSHQIKLISAAPGYAKGFYDYFRISIAID